MSIPAESAFHLETLHGFETRNHVFDITSQKMSIVRKPVGKWRAVIEDKFVRGAPLVDAGLKSAILSPILERLLFQLWEAWARVYAVTGSIYLRVHRGFLGVQLTASMLTFYKAQLEN